MIVNRKRKNRPRQSFYLFPLVADIRLAFVVIRRLARKKRMKHTVKPQKVPVGLFKFFHIVFKGPVSSVFGAGQKSRLAVLKGDKRYRYKHIFLRFLKAFVYAHALKPGPRPLSFRSERILPCVFLLYFCRLSLYGRKSTEKGTRQQR